MSTAALDAAIAAFEPELPLAVALSGGADSTALLLACARRWPGQVVAVHVNHGLQAAATQFEAACVALCQRLGVPLQVCRVQAHAAPGQSPEDAARRARYAAFDALARMDSEDVAINSIAIAHNADDQAETVLLALGRGAGLGGLSAMPAQWRRAGKHYYRPLLAVPSASIRDWLREQGQDWVEDPSNTDTRFLRNHIRHTLVPAFAAVFPHMQAALARSARHAAQAQRLLDEWADADLAALRTGGGIGLRALRDLGSERQAHVLRRWLKCDHGVVGSTAQLDELVRQVRACATRGHRIDIKVGNGFVRRQGAELRWFAV
ncbi:MAG: tRNA lysidine(34) synthetase TilS [Rhodoferax sp.]